MGDLIANMSMSLDGFVEDAAGGVDDVFSWIPLTAEGSASAGYLRDARAGIGALIAGRRLFDLAKGWGGRHPVDVPVFVVTHRVPDDWAYPDAPFTFVTDGVASAVEQARAAAGDRNVAVAGKPFFAGLGETPVRFEDPTVVPGLGVTHLLYRVRRS